MAIFRKNKPTNKPIVDGKLEMSASSTNGETWTGFHLLVRGYDEKTDKTTFHRLEIDRDEAWKIRNQFDAWLNATKIGA